MHDAHIHIHDEKLVQILVKNQIPVIANAQNQSQYKFLSSFQNLKISVGLHPWDVETIKLSQLEPLFEKADYIGEIGMDNEWCQTDLQKQKEIFEQQLAIASNMNKPVILHSKGMEKEIVQCLKKYKNTYIVHWYSCLNYLQDYIDLGCYFTIGPSICTDVAVRQVALKTPIDKILIETDGLSAIEWVEDHPVEISDYPLYLERTISEIAKMRNISKEAMEKQIDANFSKIAP